MIRAKEKPPQLLEQSRRQSPKASKISYIYYNIKKEGVQDGLQQQP